MTIPRLIAFCGPAGSGKSTAASYLVSQHGCVRTRFAEPLKAMLRAIGLTDRQLDGDLKCAPCELLGGQTPRWAMQTLGTEWGRDLMHPDFWMMLWAATARKHFEQGRQVVVDDLRFPNEAALVKRLGGVILRIEKPETERAAHISEWHEIAADASIHNEGVNFEVFHSRIDGALQRLAG